MKYTLTLLHFVLIFINSTLANHPIFHGFADGNWTNTANWDCNCLPAVEGAPRILVDDKDRGASVRCIKQE